MAKITVFYDHEPELMDIILALGKKVVKVKRQPSKGKSRRAYIELKSYQGLKESV